MARGDDRVAQIRASPDAHLLLDLVREFLDHYELDYTASVMHAEARIDELEGESVDRDALRVRLGLPTPATDVHGQSTEPMLAQLLTAFLHMVCGVCQFFLSSRLVKMSMLESTARALTALLAC